ncbi:alpha/beta hydrolase [Corynebacterium sp. 3HC-13]|uniref:alpha/beta hydrolase family protein n=1 Tax=Corynebacterium poyangense TaxID=2684405 RepID=UPI001CCCB44C|nr:alpha/beta hydrolase [Corynebacterium poyangense]MBZ8177316.1 alpha/beta hydrolase [Corynebacterium poyangense]
MNNTRFLKFFASAVTLASIFCLFTPTAKSVELSSPLISLDDYLASIPSVQEDITPRLSPQVSGISTELGTTGFRVTAPFNSEPGPIRKTFGQPGKHQVASTAVTQGCGPFYRFYNEVLRFNHAVNDPAECYRTAPEGNLPALGYQFIYPTDLQPGTRVPVIILSPGIGVEPGFMQRHAEFYASHGYVVALGYSLLNWFGAQMSLAAAAAHLADQDLESPIYNHVDFSRVVLVGHSAGGGSALRMSGLMGDFLHQIGREDAQIRGVIGINPGPADFSLASPPSAVPTLVLPAEHETLVPHPLSRIAFDKAVGPKWWAVVRGAEHGVYLDSPGKSIYDSLVVAFSNYVNVGDPESTSIFEGSDYRLAKDPELIGVEKY